MATEKNLGDASKQFGKFFAKLGIELDTSKLKDADKELEVVNKAFANMTKKVNAEDTIFGQIPGLTKSLAQLEPQVMKNARSILTMGVYSKKTKADNGEFYDSLGLMGKGLTNISGLFVRTGEGAMEMGAMVEASMVAATLGIAAVIMIAEKLVSLMAAGISQVFNQQETLKKFNQTLGGVSDQGLKEVSQSLNDVNADLLKFGLNLDSITQTMLTYTSLGLNKIVARNSELIKTTELLGEVTGTSKDSIAGMFSELIKGSKVSTQSLTHMSNAFVAINAANNALGVLGPVTFDQFKEAVTSAGTSLQIAASKGSEFTNKMTTDLVKMTALTNALGISVAELNSKFDESANLIGQEASGFRALLAISGGANIQNMLSNQFDRTEATLKVITKLQELNTQFGGNLNIMSQVAEKTFGISRETAIKLATTSSEQIDAIKKMQQFQDSITNNGIEKAYKSVTNTFSDTIEKFKNLIINVFHSAIANNPALQDFLRRIQSAFDTFREGAATGFLSKLGDIVSKSITGIVQVLNKINIEKVFEVISDAVDGAAKILDWILNIFSGPDNFLVNLGKQLLELVVKMAKVFAGALANSLKLTGLGSLFGISASDEAEKLYLQSEIDRLQGDKQKDTDDRLSRLSKATQELADSMNIVNNAQLKQTNAQLSKYAGLKETDVAFNEQGKLVVVGLERLELEKKQTQLLENIEKNTRVANEKATVIHDRIYGTPQQPSQNPQAPKQQVAARAR